MLSLHFLDSPITELFLQFLNFSAIRIDTFKIKKISLVIREKNGLFVIFIKDHSKIKF